MSESRVCKECVKCGASVSSVGQVQKSGFASGRTQSEQKEKEEEEEVVEEEEEEEALCRNTGLAYSFALLELNPQTETLH